MAWEYCIQAKNRLAEYNVYWVPMVYFDGGYSMVIGADTVPNMKKIYTDQIDKCHKRAVADMDVDVQAGDVIHVSINPYAMLKHINFNKVQQDDYGRYTFEVRWAKNKTEDTCALVGGVFITKKGVPYK